MVEQQFDCEFITQIHNALPAICDIDTDSTKRSDEYGDNEHGT
jgi:hypothetical protein